jgi:glycosyltransferase involved in cell wall biosynthesis
MEYNFKYILYLGRGDRRKNINGLIKAFGVLKHQQRIPHKLILAGPNIGYKIPRDFKDEVCFLGYVEEKEKWELLRNADVFAFPSFYEGFGIPVLEAQKVGTAVVCSDTSSLPEIVGDSALMFNPYHFHEIAKAIYKIISDKQLKEELIRKGFENVKNYSWKKTTEETIKIITS